jgi:hypothetical protein
MKALLLLFAFLLLPTPAATGATVYNCPREDGTMMLTNLYDGPACTIFTRDDPPPPPVGDGRSRPYEEAIARVAEKYGVETNLLRAVIKCESNFNSMAISRAGAQGLMQLMPETARLRKVNDPFDAAQNMEGGTRHLKYLLEKYGGNKTLALAAYNAGEGAVRRHGGVPPYKETQNYVKVVLDHYDRYCTYGTGDDAITRDDIQSFIRSDGTLQFTNQPWKYSRDSEYRRTEEK